MSQVRWARLGVTAMGLVGVGTLTSSCLVPVSGGGFIQSAGSPDAKAHFAFSLKCDTAGNLVGIWLYHDKTPGGGFTSIDVTGHITSSDNFPCSSIGTPMVFSGAIPYSAQGPCDSSCSGNAELLVISGTGEGKTKGSLLGIALTTGPDAGYSNGPLMDGQPDPRPVVGGNLTLG